MITLWCADSLLWSEKRNVKMTRKEYNVGIRRKKWLGFLLNYRNEAGRPSSDLDDRLFRIRPLHLHVLALLCYHTAWNVCLVVVAQKVHFAPPSPLTHPACPFSVPRNSSGRMAAEDNAWPRSSLTSWRQVSWLVGWLAGSIVLVSVLDCQQSVELYGLLLTPTQ